ncbi:hypothetical protein [Ruminococcus sp.]|uniref:hypothetical protein n=1 Tax=Ruminococcus sp. TaxID=41978 RepID=UPI0025E6D20D|nr:hypothetical protein [Ruminococcus sp.]
MSSIIAEYHQSVKERKYRYLFVYECRKAAEMIQKKSKFDFQEIVMAAGAGFLNHIDYHLLYQHLYPGSITPYLRIDMPSAMIIVEWYAKKRPIPKEWDTERLESSADYYTQKKRTAPPGRVTWTTS